MAPELLRRLVSVSLSGACLLVVAEGCLWLLRGVLTPNQRRVVWILVLLRLLCPWSFSGGLLDWAAEETRVPSPTTVFVPSAEPIAHPQMDAVQEMQSPVPLETGLVLVWAAGALAVLTRRGNDYVRFRRAVQAGQRPAGGAWQAVYTRLTVKDLRPPRLAISSAVPGPMLVGLVRPRILLPNQDILSQEEQEDVLSHELTHWRRKDLWWKWLAMMAVAVHWFNPAAWRLLERLDRDSELSCDWIVVRHWDAARRTRYGALLLRLAAGGMHTPSAALFSQNSD